jgi:hypothetical protein
MTSNIASDSSDEEIDFCNQFVTINLLRRESEMMDPN